MTLNFQLILDVTEHVSYGQLPRLVRLVRDYLASTQVTPPYLLALFPTSCLNYWRKRLLVRAYEHLADATLVILNFELEQAPAWPDKNLLQWNIRAVINQFACGGIPQDTLLKVACLTTT